MIYPLMYFSVLAGRLLQEGHPPAEAMSLNFGFSPINVVVIVLLVTGVAWLAMNVQAARADLHADAHHNGHGHDEHGHDTHAPSVH